jgi:CAAX prenyl protease-like protein
VQRAWPYVLPYSALLVCAELARWLSGTWEAPLLALRVAAPALLVAVAWQRGAFPELRGGGSGARGWLPDVGFGLALAGLWLAPYLLFPSLPRGEPFDPDALGEGMRPAWLALRFAGFVLVSPLVEELFVRSFLHRVVEAWPDWEGFHELPVAHRHSLAFWVTVGWFAASHTPWEWWVAVPTAALLNGWLYWRGSLRNVWIAHATTNGALWALVVFGPGDLWSFL